MQTAELQFVLRNSFAIDELRRILRTVSPSEDPFEAAVEAILNEDENGLSVLDELDRASLKQRRKVRSMSAKELRSGVAFEFMERGRTLAHTVWALMRDDRIAAKTMADSLVQQFNEPIIEDMGVTDEPIAVSELLSDITAPDTDLEIDLSNPHPEDPDDEPFIPAKTAQDVLSEEEISREVDSLIDSLKDDVPLDLIEVDDDDDEDITIETFDLENDDKDAILETPEGEADSEDFMFSDLDMEALNQEVVDELSDEPDEDDLSSDALSDEEEAIHTLEDVDSLIASFQDMEDSPSGEDEFNLGAKKSPAPFVYDENISVELGGVPIPLSALQHACERVFQEPVELVIDETLTRDDKIVVVGKQCGVRVLQGPSCAITAPDEDFVPSDAPVVVSPASLQSALSTIHGENVEIVPDARLLSRGIVVFAGQTIGIGMYEHPRMQVLVDANGAAEPSATSQEAVELQNRIQLLEERLSALEAAPTTIAAPAAVAPEPEPEPEIEPAAELAPEPEPEAEECLSEESISLDEIESEELSPVTEDINEDDLLAAIALQDDDEEDDIDLSDLSGLDENVAIETEEEPEDDSLNLDAIEDLVGGDLDDAKSSEEEIVLDADEEELDLEGLDLGELGLDADEEDEPESKKAESAEEEPTTSDDEEIDLGELGELDLDSLGEDSLTDDALGELGLGEGDEEGLDLDESDLGDLDLEIDMGDDEDESDADDSAIGDALDLDVLSELDEGGDDDFTPHKVFNGERILLLGGEADHDEDYQRIVQEIGGAAEWHGELNGMGAEEISDLVDQCDLIMTLTADALSDPGILQAVNYAQENNKRLFEHHSANPVSVQKQLVKLVEDGQV